MFSSTFSLTTLALPWYSSATDSTVGESIRQGAHHEAQKSTSTGWDDFKTSLSKFVSLTSVTNLFIDLSFHITTIILQPSYTRVKLYSARKVYAVVRRPRILKEEYR